MSVGVTGMTIILCVYTVHVGQEKENYLITSGSFSTDCKILA